MVNNVKSEKGVTLISLIIYVLILVIVVSMLSAVSSVFFNNTEYLTNNAKYISEFNKFNMYFIEDVKKNKSAEVTSNQIKFEDGTVYTYVLNDRGIYRNKVKICENIAYCMFEDEEKVVNNVTKKIIIVKVVIDASNLFETTNRYVLRYW